MFIIMLLLTIIMFVLFFTLGSVVLKFMYTICIGLPISICLVVFGALFCVTIIGIPVGMLLFKLAGFVLVPFHFHLF